METNITTPFGRRSMTLAHMASQVAARDVSTRKDAADLTVHKWRLFRALTEAKIPLGVTDRDLAVLNALLSFHQETTLTLPTTEKKPGREDDDLTGIIVFPSNRELSIRAHGMAPTTLRRHLAALVDAGLIIRRDSPNGKRYARRGQGGAIASAFGFDLTPLVARADEIENLAEEVRAESKAIRLLRERVTLSRRDIVKMIATGIEEGVPGDWEQYHTSYATLSGRYARNSQRLDLEELSASLRALAVQIQNVLETHLKEEKMAGNDSQNGRHIQYQNRNLSNLEPSLQEGRPERLGSNDEQPGPAVTDENEKPIPQKYYPLGMVLEACPDIVYYARGGIKNWRDLATTAATVRSALGVSPNAWAQALETLGEHDASIAIAAILQRGEEIKSAGGYLRVLTAKARTGDFSIGPVLMALLRGKLAKGAREWKAG